MSPGPDSAFASSSGAISVAGFIKAPGRYGHREGMTVEDALDEAGDYEECESCQAFWEDFGDHSTYSNPPRVRRAGQRLQLPKKRAEWMRFILQPGDEIEFRHVAI